MFSMFFPEFVRYEQWGKRNPQDLWQTLFGGISKVFGCQIARIENDRHDHEYCSTPFIKKSRCFHQSSG
jgi:hypothetical protein